MNLYKVYTKKFGAYVISSDPTRAYTLFRDRLNSEDMGFFCDRDLSSIEQLSSDENEPWVIVDSSERELAHVVVIKDCQKNFKIKEIIDLLESALTPFRFDVKVEFDRGKEGKDACIGVHKARSKS